MPARIGHQPPENYFGALGHDRWKQELPTKPGLYWYTEFQVRDRAEAVWLCKIYRYRHKLWVRFYTGPYRIRMRGRSHIMYARTLLVSVPLLNGNERCWYKIGHAPKAPIGLPSYKHQTGGLPAKPGRITKPKVKVRTVLRKKYKT